MRLMDSLTMRTRITIRYLPQMHGIEQSPFCRHHLAEMFRLAGCLDRLVGRLHSAKYKRKHGNTAPELFNPVIPGQTIRSFGSITAPSGIRDPAPLPSFKF